MKLGFSSVHLVSCWLANQDKHIYCNIYLNHIS